MFKKEYLFSSPFFTARVDPSSYDKKSIVKTIINNYEKSPIRNKWEDYETGDHGLTNIHHYYNDWDNPNFDKPDLSSLLKVYDKIWQDFCIFELKFKTDIKYTYDIQNITVCKTIDNKMKIHNHYFDNIYYAAVHYISCDENSHYLSFHNNTPWFEYAPHMFRKTIIPKLDEKNIDNSSYFRHWDHTPIEDEMIIFPSYLNHDVYPTTLELKKHRIAVVINFKID